MKKKLFSIVALLLIAVTGAWAQGSLTSTDKTVWTLSSMPAYDIMLTAENYTDITEDAVNFVPTLGKTLVTGATGTVNESDPKPQYIQPTTEEIKLQYMPQLMASSLERVETTGLGSSNDESLEYDKNEGKSSWEAWQSARDIALQRCIR